jgi:protein transport protein SEC23
MATYEEYLQNQQSLDGIQMTWNIIPHSKVDAQKLVVPVTACFTPLKVYFMTNIDLIDEYYS